MNTIKQNEEVKVLVNVLFSEFKSLTISPKETSKITNRSEISLKRDREGGIGLSYVKLGRQVGSDKVLYSIFDIAKHIVSRKSKVIL